MTVEEIKSRLSVANENIAKINAQRNKNIGRREALTKQLDDSIALYEQKYGVHITAENLSSELDSIVKAKEVELSKIEQILAYINAGDIDSANKLAGVSPETATSTPNAVASVKEPHVENTSSVLPQTSVSPTASKIEAPVTENVPVVESAPVPPSVDSASHDFVAPPPSFDTVAPPPSFSNTTQSSFAGVKSPSTAPTPQTLTSDETEALGMPALEGFTKPSLGTVSTDTTSDKAEDKVAPPPIGNFDAILKGTAFQVK